MSEVDTRINKFGLEMSEVDTRIRKMLEGQHRREEKGLVEM